MATLVTRQCARWRFGCVNECVWKWKPNEWKSTSQRIIHTMFMTLMSGISVTRKISATIAEVFSFVSSACDAFFFQKTAFCQITLIRTALSTKSENSCIFFINIVHKKEYQIEYIQLICTRMRKLNEKQGEIIPSTIAIATWNRKCVGKSNFSSRWNLDVWIRWCVAHRVCLFQLKVYNMTSRKNIPATTATKSCFFF